MQKRAQAVVELIVILAIALGVLLILTATSQTAYTNVNTRVQTSKATIAVNDLADAAERVYQQGPGSKTTVFLSVPIGVQFVQVENRTLRYNMWGGDQNQDVYRTFPFNVSGILPYEEGNYWVSVQAQIGYVLIGDINDTTVPVISNLGASVTNQTALITWLTDEKSDSKVLYDTSPVLALSSSDSTVVTTHSIPLTSLMPNTLYYYQAQSCDPSGNCGNSSVLTFTTLKNSVNSNSTYLVDEASDEVIYFGTSMSGAWSDTNLIDNAIRAMGDSEIQENITYLWDGFESGTFNSMWTPVNGTGDWNVTSSGTPFAGTYSLLGVGGNDPVSIEFANVTHETIDASTATNITLSFVHRCEGLLEDSGSYRDDLFIDAYDGMGWNVVANWSGIDTISGSCPSSYTAETYDLTNQSNGNFQFRIRHGLTFDQELWRIDDINLTVDLHQNALNMTYLIDNVSAHDQYMLAIIGHGMDKPFSIYADGTLFFTLNSSKRFNDGFERLTYGSNWTRSGGGDWTIQSDLPFLGSNYSRGQGNSKGSNGYLTFDTRDISSARNGTFSFVHYCSSDFDDSGGTADSVYIELYNGTWQTVDSWTGVEGGGGTCPSSYTRETYSLENYMTSNFQVRLRHAISQASEYWYVDDIELNTTRYEVNESISVLDLQDAELLLVINSTPASTNGSVQIDFIELYGITT